MTTFPQCQTKKCKTSLYDVDILDSDRITGFFSDTDKDIIITYRCPKCFKLTKIYSKFIWPNENSEYVKKK